MQETLTPKGLLDAKTINPHDIGARQTSDQSKRLERLRRIISKPKLTTTEIDDLKMINSDDLTLEMIKLFAANHLNYLTSAGKVRYKESLKKEFDEAKMLVVLLDQGKYEQAAKFFLDKARSEWRGDESNNQPDEWSMVLASGEYMANVPQDVIGQGETAILEHVRKQKGTVRLRMASTSPGMYLKQAAVLTRML